MEELYFKELERRISGGETRYVEFKRIEKLVDSDEILEQLSAFSNRDGGHLLFGIQDHRSFEGQSLDADAAMERIGHLIRDRTSPLADVTPRLYSGQQGMVLDLTIRKRTGIPVAVVRRQNHEITSRRYYIRTDTGSRFVDDRTLEWLFLNQRDPEVSDRINIRVPYRLNEISLVSLPGVSSMTSHYLVGVFQSLSDSQKEILRQPDPDNMMRFIAEILPYCFLSQMAWTYANSWKVDIHRTSIASQVIRLPAESETFDLTSLPDPDPQSILGMIGFNFPKAFPIRSKISLPPGTDLTVECETSDKRSASLLKLKLDDSFEITFQTSSTMWSIGMPRVEPSAAQHSLVFADESIGCVTSDVIFQAAFESPNFVNDDLFEHLRWAEQLSNELRVTWDWDTNTGSRSDHVLHSIHTDLQKLIDRN